MFPGSVTGLDGFNTPGKLIAIPIQLLVGNEKSRDQCLLTHRGAIGLDDVNLGANLLMKHNDIAPSFL
jgi:hypothetical protein